MKIIIEYEGSWRNSFLDGSNTEPLPPKGRNFIASMHELRKPNHYIQRKITKDTVMGILNRLIGEQAKLYQARQRPNYYFKKIESVLQESDIQDFPIISNEVVYLRNISGNTERDSFTGLIKTDDPWLQEAYASEFWSVLWMDLGELYLFVQDEAIKPQKNPTLHPLEIINKFKEISEIRADNNHKIKTIADILSANYPKFILNESNNKVKVLSLYCSALYLNLDRLSKRYDTNMILAPRGGLTGISHNNFTIKNFMKRFSTGPEKMVWGNPYFLKTRNKGEGEVLHTLQKATGQLVINLKISEKRAIELQNIIENSGVSSFYLGKKGFAYVSHILI